MIPMPTKQLASWNPKTVDRPHPDGEPGIRSSLDEVAAGIIATLNDPVQLARVRTYSIDKLAEAKDRGELRDDNEGRAAVLLKAVQTEKLWVPDPVGIEYMPAPHHMACTKSKNGEVCVRGDDCDGQARLLGAMFSSVGIYTLVVGHAYDRDKQIEHVLCAIHNGSKWMYADPSTSLKLGKCLPFTRERVIAIPTGEMLCDAAVCVGPKIKTDQIERKIQGRFVGVGGPPRGRQIVWLHGIGDEV